MRPSLFDWLTNRTVPGGGLARLPRVLLVPSLPFVSWLFSQISPPSVTGGRAPPETASAVPRRQARHPILNATTAALAAYL
jgi:hypothetical protein